jgi:nicotinamidase-related amidase
LNRLWAVKAGFKKPLKKPANNSDLHGNAPDNSPVVLLLVDVINDLEFPDNRELIKNLAAFGRNLFKLKKRAQRAGIAIVYVNDNFGRWRSDFNKQVEHCLEEGVCGAPLTRLLKPEKEDYFVLKPKHSGFFSSTLETLLVYLQAKILIITGIAGDRCVLFTASDAFLRDYQIFVPSDCTISNHVKDNREALKLMRRVLKADTRPAAKIDLARLKKHAPG